MVLTNHVITRRNIYQNVPKLKKKKTGKVVVGGKQMQRYCTCFIHPRSQGLGQVVQTVWKRGKQR